MRSSAIAEAREFVGREREVAATEHRDLVHDLHAARVEALRAMAITRCASGSSAAGTAPACASATR